MLIMAAVMGGPDDLILAIFFIMRTILPIKSTEKASQQLWSSSLGNRTYPTRLALELVLAMMSLAVQTKA